MITITIGSLACTIYSIDQESEYYEITTSSIHQSSYISRFFEDLFVTETIIRITSEYDTKPKLIIQLDPSKYEIGNIIKTFEYILNNLTTFYTAEKNIWDKCVFFLTKHYISTYCALSTFSTWELTDFGYIIKDVFNKSNITKPFNYYIDSLDNIQVLRWVLTYYYFKELRGTMDVKHKLKRECFIHSRILDIEHIEKLIKMTNIQDEEFNHIIKREYTLKHI